MQKHRNKLGKNLRRKRLKPAFDRSGNHIGWSDEDTGRLVLTGALAGGLGYGAYKLFGGGSGTTPGEAKPGGPWLYKLNPQYWVKSAKEKRYVDIEKQRGKRNVELNKELAAAERAYWTSNAAAQKEAKVSTIDSQLKQQGAVSGDNMTTEFWKNDYTHLPADEVRLTNARPHLAWAGAFSPLIKEGSALGFDSPDEPDTWNGHFSKPASKINSGTKSTLTFRPSKTALGLEITPDDPAMWNSHFSKPAFHVNSATRSTNSLRPTKTALGGPGRPRRLGTEYSTEFSTVDPSVMSTEFRMSGMSGPGRPRQLGTEYSTAFSTIDPSVMSTEFRMTGIGEDFVGDGKPGANVNTDKQAVAALRAAGIPVMPGAVLSPEQSSRAADALLNAFAGDKNAAGKWLAGFIERTQISWYGPDGAIYTYRGGRRFMAAPPAPKDVSLRTSAMRGDSSFIGAAAAQKAQAQSAAAQGKFIASIAASKGPIIAHIAHKLGLSGKQKWSSKDRDSIAASLLNEMMTDTKSPPNSTDAHVARQAVKVFGGARGVSVSGDDEIGAFNPLKAAGQIVTAPVRAAWWGAKQVGKGAKWTGQKLGIVKKPKNAAQKKRAQLIAAAKRRAAAAQRIRAAERKHEAAVLEREQARKIADQEAEALEAEAAAQEAEAIAIEAEAMKDVSDVPSIEDDYEVSGEDFVGSFERGVTVLGTWAVIGALNVPVGKHAQVAATNTKQGARLRAGAQAARAAKTNPAANAALKQQIAKAQAGNPIAQKVVATVRAGAVADAQRLNATKRNAGKMRAIANQVKRDLRSLVKFTQVSGSFAPKRGRKRVGGRPGGKSGGLKKWSKGIRKNLGLRPFKPSSSL